MRDRGFAVARYRHSPDLLKAVEERQQLVVGLELPRLAVERDGLGEDLLFQRQVSVEVDLGGVDGLVPQPERDHGLLHAGVQQVHRRGVPQAVERDVFLLEGGAALAGDRDVLFQKTINTVGAQSSAADAREHELALVWIRFIEPCREYGGDRLAERDDALLAALAVDFDVGARAERHVLTLQACHFRQAHAGLQGRQQQRMVPAADAGGLVGSVQEGVDLGTCQEVDQLAVEPLGRHGQDALYLSAVRRHFIGGEAEERPDRSEAQVAGGGAHAPRFLQFVQEGGDERRVELLEGQPVGRRVQPPLSEAQQQPEGVAIGADRMRADLLLLHQPLREEPLQECREGRDRGCHAGASQRC